MSLELPFGIKTVVNKSNIDERYGPHPSIEEALVKTQGTRELGLTVGVIEESSVVEYWFQTGITDEDLTPKLPPQIPSAGVSVDYITLSDYSPAEDIQPGIDEVRIGNVIWRTYNEKYDDGLDGIYYPNNDQSNVDDFGLLYDKDAILRILAENPGWRIPTYNDYSELEIITTQVTEFSGQLIFEMGAGSSENQSFWDANVIWDNSSGLSLVPSGWRNEAGVFTQFKNSGVYWMDRIGSPGQRYATNTLNIDSNTGLPRIVITKQHITVPPTTQIVTLSGSLRLVKDI